MTEHERLMEEAWLEGFRDAGAMHQADMRAIGGRALLEKEETFGDDYRMAYRSGVMCFTGRMHRWQDDFQRWRKTVPKEHP